LFRDTIALHLKNINRRLTFFTHISLFKYIYLIKNICWNDTHKWHLCIPIQKDCIMQILWQHYFQHNSVKKVYFCFRTKSVGHTVLQYRYVKIHGFSTVVGAESLCRCRRKVVIFNEYIFGRTQHLKAYFPILEIS